MKKNILILTLIAAALLGDASAYDPSPPAAGSPPPSVAGKPLPPPPPPPPSGGGGTNCATSSWNPELYSFYGAKGTIVEKLGKIPAKLSERRVFVQVTQGDSSADVKLYEQQGNGTFTVTEWTTTQTSSLLADIDKAIVANKGVNCVGEQVKGILAKELKEGKVSKGVAAPASPKAAFAHSVKEASGEFIKSTIIILC